MKKLLACILTLVLSLCCLTACDTSVSFHVHTLGDWEYNEDQHWQPVYCLWGCNVNVVSYDHFDENGDCICDVCPCYVESDISKLFGITREDHENYTVFRFNNFSGKAVLTMDRTRLEADVIYYTGKLSQGAVRVTYDRGPWDSTETLYTFYENVNIPAENSTVGKINQDELDFIFEALSPASGEIIISFVPFEHEHTFEYIFNEHTHQMIYTCGCVSPCIEEEHINYDADLFCDVCGYNLSVICEHQWDDGIEVESGSGGYVMQYTCSLCGSKRREIITIIPPSGVSHSISYQSDRTKELLMEGFTPTEANPGDIVVLRTHPIMDADLALFANGVKCTLTHADSDYWEYVFTMPDEDVVITHEISDGLLPE